MSLEHIGVRVAKAPRERGLTQAQLASTTTLASRSISAFRAVSATSRTSSERWKSFDAASGPTFLSSVAASARLVRAVWR